MAIGSPSLRYPTAVYTVQFIPSGNPHLRFDEGRVGRAPALPSLLLYRLVTQVERQAETNPARRSEDRRQHRPAAIHPHQRAARVSKRMYGCHGHPLPYGRYARESLVDLVNWKEFTM